MVSTLDIAQHLASVLEYRDISKIKEEYVSQVGRVWKFDSTKKFLEENHVIGVLDWSKKEQNLFSFLLKNNSHKELIIHEYNNGLIHSDGMSGKLSVFKEIASISELLKAPTYSQGEFPKDVLKKCIEWGFDGDNENVKLLKKSLSLFADKKTISGFIDGDSQNKKSSFALLKGMEIAEETKDMKSSILVGWAALTSLAIPNLYNVVSTTTKAGLDGATTWISQTGELGTKIADFAMNSPNLISSIVIGATILAFYKTFQESHKIIKKMHEKEKIKYVAGVNIKEIDELNVNSVLSQRILGKLIRTNPYDIRDKQNNEYIVLCSFVVDKLKNPTLEVPTNMAIDLNLTKSQVKKLNKLTKDDIHEVSLINNPAARSAILLGNISENQKGILKTISLMEDVGGLKLNADGKFFKSIDSIRNITPELIEKIKIKNPEDQKIMANYLNLYTNESGNCLNSVLRGLDRSLDTRKPIVTLLQAEMDTEYFNMKPETPSNEELAYFKRIWNFATSKKERIEGTVNSDVKNVIEESSRKYGFSFAQDVNNLNPTWKDMVVKIGVDMKSIVLNNINKIRDAIGTNSSQNINTQRIH